jgi:hypothetical protein
VRYPLIKMVRVWALAAALIALGAAPVGAHRPYFEEQDIRPEAPWSVDDPTISTAIYATLDSAQDVDYVRFQGRAGQTILLALTIPQVEGQDLFAPTMALMGPGLPQADLPPQVARPEGGGALVFPPAPGPAPTFFEPFSRTSYWDRQEERVPLPADGPYTVAVWHPEGQVGRYVFVVGDRELPGGDPTFPLKMRSYWAPVGTPSRPLQTWWPVMVGAGVVLLTAMLLTLWLVYRARHRRRSAALNPQEDTEA